LLKDIAAVNQDFRVAKLWSRGNPFDLHFWQSDAGGNVSLQSGWGGQNLFAVQCALLRLKLRCRQNSLR
jgi:hypothetical protein